MNFQAPGGAGRNQIVEDSIDDLFIEAARIAIGGEVKFERFRFNTLGVRNVADMNRGKIRLSSHRAHRREFRAVEIDPVAAFLESIGKNFQRRSRGLGREGDIGTAQKAELILGFLFFSVMPEIDEI